MIQRKRTRQAKFKRFKKNTAESVGGRKILLKHFPKGIERKTLYDALLFRLKIKGGIENSVSLTKFDTLRMYH